MAYFLSEGIHSIMSNLLTNAWNSPAHDAKHTVLFIQYFINTSLYAEHKYQKTYIISNMSASYMVMAYTARLTTYTYTSSLYGALACSITAHLWDKNKTVTWCNMWFSCWTTQLLNTSSVLCAWWQFSTQKCYCAQNVSHPSAEEEREGEMADLHHIQS